MGIRVLTVGKIESFMASSNVVLDLNRKDQHGLLIYINSYLHALKKSKSNDKSH